MRAVLLTLLLILLPGLGHAQQSATTHELAGFSTSTFDGGQGVFTYTLACQSDFGSTARMCDSLEVIRTTNVPSGLGGVAWVRPHFVSITESSGYRYALDVSGMTDGGTRLTCNGWAYSTGSVGLVVGGLGGFFSNQACQDLNPVACCVPIPDTSVAAVPFLLPWVRGLFVGVLLLAAGAGLLARRVALLDNGVRKLRG
jgi:hypothetical protein